MVAEPNVKEITPKAYLDRTDFDAIFVAQYHAL